MVQSHYFLGINVVLEQNVVSREEARRNDEKRTGVTHPQAFYVVFKRAH